MKTIKFISLGLLLMVSMSLMAHPPKKIEAKYNAEKKTIQITLNHDVKDVAAHFIKTVIISVNGKEVLTKSIEKQSSLENEDITIELKDVKSGDEIVITGVCNKFGKKTMKMKI